MINMRSWIKLKGLRGWKNPLFFREGLELFSRLCGCTCEAINTSNENSWRCNCFASRLKSSVKCRAWGANFPFCSHRAPPGGWARTAKGIFSVTVSVSAFAFPPTGAGLCASISAYGTHRQMGATFCNYISPKLKVNNRHFSYKLLDGEIKCLYTVRLQRHQRHPWMMWHHHQRSVSASNWGNSGALRCSCLI